MSFEDIPEDLNEGYPCECGGSVSIFGRFWECDSCDFKKSDESLSLDPDSEIFQNAIDAPVKRYEKMIAGKMYKNSDCRSCLGFPRE